MNKKLISFTVLLITALLATITCVYAWFVTNTEANATGISIRTSDVAITGGNLSRYIAIYDEASNTYSYDEQNGNIDSWSSNTYPASFDNLNDYDKIIYKLGFKVNKDSYSISFTRNDSSVSSIISTSNNVSTNFLSNIASFSLLSQNSDSTLSLVNFSDGTSEKSLSYVSDSIEKLDEIILEKNVSVTSGEVVTLYLLFDYNKTNINKLWSDNVGINVSKIYFKEDIEFRVR
jgi:hypothetical protein